MTKSSPAAATPAPEATDAEIVAAIRRGIELGTIVEVTPELLAQMAADADEANTASPAEQAGMLALDVEGFLF